MDEYAVRTSVTRISRTIDTNASRTTSRVIGSITPASPARSAGCRARRRRRASPAAPPWWPRTPPRSPGRERRRARAAARAPTPDSRGSHRRTRPDAVPRGPRRSTPWRSVSLTGRLRDQPIGGEPGIDELDRSLGVRVSVRQEVLAMEVGLDGLEPWACRAGLAERDVQLEGLALVTKIERAKQPLLRGLEAFELQLVSRGALHLEEQLAGHRQALADRPDTRPNAIVLDL